MLRNNTLSRADLSNDRKGILDIHYGDVLIRYRAVVDVSTLQGPSINITDNRFLGDQLTDGDIIMADTAEDTSAGKCVEIEGVMHRNVVAGLHTIPLRPATPSSHGYWGQYLNSASFRNQLFSKMQGTKVISLSRTTVSNATVRYPSLAEQRRIGDFFSTFDSLIAAAERQEALLRQKKQAYLQLMFPREGETEPRLRFAGYNGEWERRQLGEVAEVHNGRDYKHLRPGSIPVYGTSGYMLSVDDALSWNDDAVGIGRKGTIDRPYILRAPFWTVDTLFFVTPRPSTPLEFLLTVFESVNWESKDESTGVPSLTKQAIVNTAVKVPNTSEQRRIGEFFTQIDHMIEIISKQAAALQTMKRAYLQKMFI